MGKTYWPLSLRLSSGAVVGLAAPLKVDGVSDLGQHCVDLCRLSRRHQVARQLDDT
jgi:hypothetical protein